MPRDGCRECLYRRIRCDKTDPACQKCIKKGIECSGVGKFCFVSGATRRRRRLAPTSRASQLDSIPLPSNAVVEEAQERRTDVVHATGDDLNDLSTEQGRSDLSETQPGQQLTTLARRNPVWPQALYESANSFNIRADLALEGLKPGVSNLLLTFSSTIASIMVVFDHGFNGYRDVILQLAFTDDLVQRAVCVCSAFYLGHNNPALYEVAEKGRSAIISALSTQMMSDQSRNVFNISTVATVLLLLVGETVTGSDEFSPLYMMLAALSQNNDTFSGATATSCAFFHQQIKMFQLFTPPLLGQEPITCVTHQDLDPYIDFLTCGQTGAPELAAWVSVYKAAIGTARKIYMMHFHSAPDLVAMESMVDLLRTLTEPLQQDTPGMHALVWVYFIAAASTQDLSNQSYFVEKLRQIYNKTQMHNIIVAVERLEEMWTKRQNGWTVAFPMMRPVLAI